MCPGSRFPLFLTMQQNNRNERERAFSNSVALRRRLDPHLSFTGERRLWTLLPASSLARFPSSLFLPNQPPHPFPRPRDPHGPLRGPLLGGAVPRQHAPRLPCRPLLWRRRRRGRRGRGSGDRPEALFRVPPRGAGDLYRRGASAVVGQRGEELEDCVIFWWFFFGGGKRRREDVRAREKERRRPGLEGSLRIYEASIFLTYGSALRALLSRAA